MKVIDVFPRKFFTYAAEDEVDFGDGLTVIVGANGAGKTALGLEAVCWTVWGKTTRGTVPDGDVTVMVDVDDDARGWEISRLRKGKRAGALGLRRYGIGGSEEWDDMTGQTSIETQAKIDALVGTWERFCAERVFSQRMQRRFGSATDKERKALLEAVLGLERHERAAKLARAELGARKAKLQAAQQAGAAARAALEQARRAVEGIDAGIGESVESLREAVEMHRTKAAKAEAEAARLEAEARAAEARSGALGRTATQAARDAQAILQGRDRAAKALAEVDRRLASAAAMGDCPVCMTPSASIPRDKLAAHFQAEAAPLRAEVAEGTRALEGARAEAAELAEDVQKAQEAASRARRAADEAGRGARALAGDAALERALAAEERRAEVRAGAEAEIARCAGLAASAELAEGQAEVACLEVEAAAEALGSKGARVARMDGALASLSAEAGRILARLPVDGTGPLGIKIRGSRELAKGGAVDEVSISVVGAGGPDGEYDGTSDGERARLDAALMLGMSRVAGGEGLLVFDEIFDPLDGGALEAIAEVLQELATRRQVVVITHNPRFLDLLPASACWKVSREQGAPSRVSRAS